MRLCRDSDCAQQVGSWSAEIINYGATVIDLGDIPVQKGALYYLRYDRPDSTHSWVVYYWGPGAYNQLSALVRGYNR